MFSIVIPAYNEEKYLGKCLESVFNQDFDMKKVEVIVVDNNSKDRSAKIAKSFGAKVVFEKRQGIVFARQKGLEESRGEIIVQTDADTIVPPDWLSKIHLWYSKSERVAAVYGYWSIDNNFKAIPKIFFDLNLFLAKISHFVLKKPVLVGFNMSYKRKSLLKLGGYDLNFQRYDDIGVSRIIKNLGIVVFDPTIVVIPSARRLQGEKWLYPLQAYLEVISVHFFKKKHGLFELRKHYR